MNQYNSTTKSRFERSKRIPVNNIQKDIDYEMMLIGDQLKLDSPLFPKLDRNKNEEYLTSKAMKDFLNQSNTLELNVVEFHGSTLHIFHRADDDKDASESKMRILLPLNEISHIKESKKYTKIKMRNGKVIKTSVPFEQLKKILIHKGFINQKENILIKLN